MLRIAVDISTHCSVSDKQNNQQSEVELSNDVAQVMHSKTKFECLPNRRFRGNVNGPRDTAARKSRETGNFKRVGPAL